MVAVFHHFLVGSLFLLFAVFIPSVKSAMCPRGGLCLAKEYSDSNYKQEWEIFKDVACPGGCYDFICMRSGALMVGSGCEDSLRKVCPQATYATIEAVKNTPTHFVSGPDFRFQGCFDGYCPATAKAWWRAHDMPTEAVFKYDRFVTKYYCTYAAGSIHEVSMVLLGWITIAWIFAARLW